MHQAAVLGHPFGQALRCVRRRKDPEAVYDGLLGRSQGLSCSGHDLSVFGVLWGRTRHEQPAGNTFPSVFPHGSG